MKHDRDHEAQAELRALGLGHAEHILLHRSALMENAEYWYARWRAEAARVWHLEAELALTLARLGAADALAGAGSLPRAEAVSDALTRS